MSQVYGDGAYDTERAHAAIVKNVARATIATSDSTVAWEGDYPRNAVLAQIAANGRHP